MKARYIRISSSSQSILRQYQKKTPDEMVYVDVISGAIPFNERPAAQELIKAIEDGIIDYLSCEAVDRLGRSAYDIQSTINYLNDKSVNLKIENLGVESFVKGKINSIFKMITDVLANVAQMEREASKERQAQGIAIAVAQGKFKGRLKGSSIPESVVLGTYKNVVKELKLGGNSLRKVAAICGVSLATVQKVKRILDGQIEAK
ncbi:recombinase family protein [Flavobacterium petrolei]|uniref:recombinase family protein n=1 Tax=Flavobacterium petrolei TaxID=2259594 RepID=UPI0037581AE8